MGNSVLFKPHPQCYKSSRAWLSFYGRSFKPSDIQLISPNNQDMGAIIEDDRIHCVSFTGGLLGARAVSAKSIMKIQLFELGGNDALVVYPNSDYKKAVKSIINQRFGCAGQRCTASKRVFIHQDCYQEVKSLLVGETKKLIVGNPLEKETFLGPVVSVEAAKEIEQRIKSAENQGAQVLCGGQRDNAIIAPTIIENVTEKYLLNFSNKLERYLIVIYF